MRYDACHCAFRRHADAAFRIGGEHGPALAAGGVGVNTNAPAAELEVQRRDGGYVVGKFKNAAAGGDRSAVVDIENGDVSASRWRVSVGGTGNGIGLTAGQFYIEHFNTAVPALIIDANKNFTLYPSSGSCSLTSGAGWSCSSDRNLKQGFSAVDEQGLLAKVAALPISRWTMKGSDVPHIGRMAQDFYAAFALGEDETHINTVDGQAVALAAIQALNAQVQAQAAEIAALEKRVAGPRAPVPSIAISDTGALLLALGMVGSAVILRRRL